MRVTSSRGRDGGAGHEGSRASHGGGRGLGGDLRGRGQLEEGPRKRRAISLSPRALAGESPPAVGPVPPDGGRRAPPRRLRSCSKPGPGRSGDGRSDSATVSGVLPPSEPSSDTVRSLRSGGICLLGGFLDRDYGGYCTRDRGLGTGTRGTCHYAVWTEELYRHDQDRREQLLVFRARIRRHRADAWTMSAQRLAE